MKSCFSNVRVNFCNYLFHRFVVVFFAVYIYIIMRSYCMHWKDIIVDFVQKTALLAYKLRPLPFVSGFVNFATEWQAHGLF